MTLTTLNDLFQQHALELIATKLDWSQQIHATVALLPWIQTLMSLVWVIVNVGFLLSK